MKCILICLLILFCGFASETLALRCASADGLSVEDVRKVVKKCMKKVTQSDAGEGKNYEEYENFESDYETSNHKERNSRRDYNDRPNTYGNNFNPRINQHYEPQQTGGNFNANDRRDPYQHADNNNFNNRNNFYGNSNNHNDSHRSNSSSNHERDRACILQCFFEELKMTNNEGFPDKHKALHVLTKELRDRELKDFYTDSIQQCFHMMDVDPKQRRDRDNCLYSKTLITCLAERAKVSCADWDGETVIF